MENTGFNFAKATYSVAETLEQLSCGRTKFYELLKTKQINALKNGKKTIVPATEIARFLSTLKSAA